MAINNSLNNILGQLLGSPNPGEADLRDWKHASRLFVNNLYRLSPKFNNLFHVFMDINPALSTINVTNQIESGLLAKAISLPKFSIATKTYNAYNRKVVQQEKVSYDPVNITFHDDSADVILGVWQDYFSYYYRDSDYTNTQYNYDSKYHQRQIQNWGYTPKTSNLGNSPYFNTIQIYTLHQKRFTSYTLVRPVIQTFQHGQLTAGAWETLEHSMTVAYEAVLYASGPVSSGEVLGFDIIHYDNTPSPLAGISGIGTGIADLINGDLGFAVEDALSGLGINTGLGLNPGVIGSPSVSLAAIGASILRGQNTQSTIFAPTSSTVQQGLSASTTPMPSAGANNNTMNSQDSQVPDSGQSVPGSAAVTDTNSIAPSFAGGYVGEQIEAGGGGYTGEVVPTATTETATAPSFAGGYYGDQTESSGGGFEGGDSSATYEDYGNGASASSVAVDPNSLGI